MIGCDERCRELHCVRGSQAVHPEKSQRVFTNRLTGLDFVPSARKSCEPPKCEFGGILCHWICALEPSERRGALDTGRPPDEKLAISIGDCLQMRSRGFFHEQRHDR